MDVEKGNGNVLGELIAFTNDCGPFLGRAVAVRG